MIFFFWIYEKKNVPLQTRFKSIEYERKYNDC